MIRIILPFVLAKALNWWYRYPFAPPFKHRQTGRILRHEYPQSNVDYIMVEIVEKEPEAEHCLIRGLTDL